MFEGALGEEAPEEVRQPAQVLVHAWCLLLSGACDSFLLFF